MEAETARRLGAKLAQKAQEAEALERGTPPCGAVMADLPGTGVIRCTRPVGHPRGDRGPGHFTILSSDHLGRG